MVNINQTERNALKEFSEEELQYLLHQADKLEKIVGKLEKGEKLGEREKRVLVDLKKVVEKRFGLGIKSKAERERRERELMSKLCKALQSNDKDFIARLLDQQKRIALLCVAHMGLIGFEDFAAILIGAKSKSGPFFSTCPDLASDLKNEIALKVFLESNHLTWLHIVIVTAKEFYHLDNEKKSNVAVSTVRQSDHSAIENLSARLAALHAALSQNVKNLGSKVSESFKKAVNKNLNNPDILNIVKKQDNSPKPSVT